jgi:hypothetical protein
MWVAKRSVPMPMTFFLAKIVSATTLDILHFLFLSSSIDPRRMLEIFRFMSGQIGLILSARKQLNIIGFNLP